MAKAALTKPTIQPDETIIQKIYVIRGLKVMLDYDLAELYQVETKQLKRQVKRNINRFPEDFLFELTKEEFESLRSQIGILKSGKKIENLRSQIGTSRWGGTRYNPLAFTEQGVSALSAVLNSPIAIQVHIQIIRIFVKMREMLLTNKDILLKLEKMEKDVTDNKKDIAVIFEALKQLLNEPVKPRKRIGFKPDDL